jgi:O-antigen/teichoic acid export membrane protein
MATAQHGARGVGDPPGRTGGLRATARRLRSDHLVANAFFLFTASGLQGVLGMVFWVIGARLYSPAEVGIGTALISATALISGLSTLGFGSTFVRWLPNASDQDAYIDTGLFLSAGAALAISAGYLLLLPLIAPKLDFVRTSPWMFAGFVVFNIASATNLLTDSVFIAKRSAAYNVVADGVGQGGSKVVLVAALYGLGSWGLFQASGLAAVVAVGLSLLFMIRRFGYRPRPIVRPAIVKETFKFAGASYVAAVIDVIPTLTLPLVVLDRRGSAQAGFFYIAFAITTLVNHVSYAMAASSFAEGSHGGDFGHLVRRSGRILFGVVTPAAVILVVLSHWVLLIFGPGYAAHARGALILLALAVPAVALNQWTTVLLQLKGQLVEIIVSNLCYIGIAVLGLVWASRGIGWVGFAWLVGNLVSGALGAGFLLGPGRRRPVARIEPLPR